VFSSLTCDSSEPSSSNKSERVSWVDKDLVPVGLGELNWVWGVDVVLCLDRKAVGLDFWIGEIWRGRGIFNRSADILEESGSIYIN